MDTTSASASSGDKSNILISLLLSMLGGSQQGSGLNLPNASSGANQTMASITPPNALQRVQDPTSFPSPSYSGGMHGANDVQYVDPVEQSMSPHFNQGRLMVGGQYVDKNGDPITNFKNGGSFQQMADNNNLMTPQDLESALKSAVQQWTQANTSSTPAVSVPQAATPLPAAQPLPTYQPQTLPNPYQAMAPPPTSLGNGGFSLGGFGGSGPSVGSAISSSPYSGASAVSTGSPFADGSFNGSPITESIGPTGGAQSGAGGLTSGSGMSAGQMGSVVGAIQGIGQGIGKMFTPGVLGTMQPVPLPQGITFGYTPIRGI